MFAIHKLFLISFGSIIMIGNTPTYPYDIINNLVSKLHGITLPIVQKNEPSPQKKMFSFIQQTVSTLIVQGLTYKIALNQLNKRPSKHSLDFFYLYLSILISNQFARLITHNLAILNNTEEYLHAQTTSSFALVALITYDLFESLKTNQLKRWPLPF